MSAQNQPQQLQNQRETCHLLKSKDEDRFPDRLKMAIGVNSVRSFAFQCGLSPSVIHQYLVGKSEPTRPALIAMAKAAQVNPAWLLSGDVSMKKVNGSLLIDRDLYDRVIQAVEDYLSKEGSPLPASKKFMIYHYLYELFEETRSIDEEQLLKTLRLVV